MSHVGAANRALYCSTNHAIERLPKAMAVDLAQAGIRVDLIAPTFMETPLTEPFFKNATFISPPMLRL
jgi:NAD(P)-dependent dehydrogenase (short-subunit alcohol dehydrogenase family)